MPIETYRTGISSLGYEEKQQIYICDWPDCRNEADYNGYCELHHLLREELMREDELDQRSEYMEGMPDD